MGGSPLTEALCGPLRRRQRGSIYWKWGLRPGRGEGTQHTDAWVGLQREGLGRRSRAWLVRAPSTDRLPAPGTRPSGQGPERPCALLALALPEHRGEHG